MQMNAQFIIDALLSTYRWNRINHSIEIWKSSYSTLIPSTLIPSTCTGTSIFSRLFQNGWGRCILELTKQARSYLFIRLFAPLTTYNSSNKHSLKFASKGRRRPIRTICTWTHFSLRNTLSLLLNWLINDLIHYFFTFFPRTAENTNSATHIHTTTRCIGSHSIPPNSVECIAHLCVLKVCMCKCALTMPNE